LAVNITEDGLVAAKFPKAPKAADFTVVSNRNPSVVDTDDGLVFEGGTPANGDVAGGVFKVTPGGEFEVKAKLKVGQSIPGNWKAAGLSIRYSNKYIISGIEPNSAVQCATLKNADAGSHVDVAAFSNNYASVISGVYVKMKYVKPKPANLAICIQLAVQATTCAVTGWTVNEQRNQAGASGCLSTLSNLAASTSNIVASTMSPASNTALAILPFNSVDGSTVPTLRATGSGASTWATLAIPLPTGSVAGDACFFGVRHQYGVTFDSYKRNGWKMQSNFNGVNSDGASCHFSKVLTQDDIDAGVINIRATQSGAGCYFIASVAAGTFSNIGIPVVQYQGGTSGALATNVIEVWMSADNYWWSQHLLEVYNAYLAGEPSHVGFAAWFNNANPMSIICQEWEQSW